MLGTVDASGRAVVADFEAGIGTLTRMSEGVDAILVVVEPTSKSVEVATRVAELARERSLGPVIVVANRVRDSQDLATIRQAFPTTELVAVPDDGAIVEADRQGVAPLDLAPDAPAVQALSELAARLLTVNA